MLNLGSPRPPVLTVPEGFDVCWRIDSAEVKSSIKLRREVSSPVVNWSMRALNTTWGHDYSRMREHKRSGRTMTFGSRNLGDRALQTSCTAPSSDQVAAMMGSRYCEMGCAVTVSTR